jgi:hypothetical protein
VYYACMTIMRSGSGTAPTTTYGYPQPGFRIWQAMP